MRDTFWVVLAVILVSAGVAGAQPAEPGNGAALPPVIWGQGTPEELVARSATTVVEKFLKNLNVTLPPQQYIAGYEAQGQVKGVRLGFFGANDWYRYWVSTRGEGIRLVKLKVEEVGKQSATVRVSYGYGTQREPLQSERLQLQRGDTDLNWQIIAQVPQENEFLANAPLRWAVYMLAQQPGAWNKFQGALTQENLKQLGLASLQFTQDWNDSYACESGLVQEAMSPYLPEKRREAVWLVPGLGQSYSFNKRLSGRKVGEIGDYAHTILFYEGSDEKPLFRHEGKAALCFVDGHAKLVDAKELEALRWEP